jgi:hypothetical protein
LELFAGAMRWKRYFAAQLRPFIGGRVLEVGAGLGTTTRVLCTGRETSWICLEPDAALAGRIEEELQTGDPPCALKPEVVVGSIDAVSEESRYDTILYIDVLEHIQDDAGQLRQAALRLAAGGHLIVLSPAHQWLFSPFDRAIGHWRRYTKRTLAAVAPAEVRLVRARYLDSVGLLASLANRLLLRTDNPQPWQIALWHHVMVPLSRIADPLLGYRVGKSIIAVWQR